MWRLLAESARYDVFWIVKSVENAVAEPPVQSRQVRQVHRARYFRCARTTDEEWDPAGKPAPKCPDLSSAPGVLRHHAAERHDGD
jgi:hypothetical protein